MKGLYKAKSKKTGEWVEGSLLVLDWESDYVYIVKEFPRASTLPVSVIIADNMVLVDKETLCRYAFSLKTGKKVFEHDVLEGHLDRIYVEDVTRVEVVWGKYGWATKDKHSEDTDPVTEVDEVMWERVCGNIFDNPELMEGEAE